MTLSPKVQHNLHGDPNRKVQLWFHGKFSGRKSSIYIIHCEIGVSQGILFDLNTVWKLMNYRVPNHKEHFLIFNLWSEEQWYFDILDHFLKIQSSTIWLRLFKVHWFGLLYLNFQKQKNGESVSKLFILQIQNVKSIQNPNLSVK